MNDDRFEQFTAVCSGHLGPSKDILKLVNKRYYEADPDYTNSSDFLDLLATTEKNIEGDRSRLFVHLRDFLNILKENKCQANDILPLKRQYSDDSELSPPHKKSRACSSDDEEDNNALVNGTENEENSNSDVSKSGSESEDEGRMSETGSHRESGAEVNNSKGSAESSENDESEDENFDKEINNSESSKISENDESEDEDFDKEINNSESSKISENDQSRDEDFDKEINDSESSKISENDESGDEDINKEYLIGSITVDYTGQTTNSISSNDSSDENGSTTNKNNNVECDGEDEKFDNVLDDDDCRNKNDITNCNVGSDVEKERITQVHTNKSANSLDNDITTSKIKSGEEEKEGSDPKLVRKEDFGFSSDGSDLPDISFKFFSNKKLKVSRNLSNHVKEKENDADDSSVGKESEKVKANILENEHSCNEDDQQGKQSEQSGNSVKQSERSGNSVKQSEQSGNSVIILEDDQEENSGHDDKDIASKGERSSPGSPSGNVTRSVENVDNDSNLSFDMEIHAAACSDKESEAIQASDKTDNEDSEVETKHKTVHYITSSDEDDPFYAERAKKAREKCKKKYVISVGKHKGKKTPSKFENKNILSSSHGKLTIKNIHKPNSPKTIHKPNSPKKIRKPRSPKKISPKESPIIIVTDSNTSCDSEAEDHDSVNHRSHRNTSPCVDSKPKCVQKKVNSSVKFQLHDSPSAEECLSLNGDASEVDEAVEENKHKDTGVVERKRISFQTETLYGKGTKVKHKTCCNETKPEQCSSRDSKPISKRETTNQHDDQKPGTSSGAGAQVEEGQQADKKKGSNKQIQRLEQLLESIRNQIERVRTRELDLDALESEVSDYILEDKLKKKFVKVYEKLCALHNAMPSTGRPTEKYFRYQGTRYPDINRKLEKFINRRKMFPDYHDVRNIIIKVSKAKRLHLSGRNMEDLAREAFTDIGNQLQQRRQKDMELEETHTTMVDTKRFSEYNDPALFDPALKRKLDSNRKQGKTNMQQVLDKYAALQYCTDDKSDSDDDDDDDEEVEEEEEEIALEEEEESRPEFDLTVDTVVLPSEEENTSPCLQIENVTCSKRRQIRDESDLYNFSPSKKKKIGENLVKYSDAQSRHFGTMLGLAKVQTPTSDTDAPSDTDMPEIDEEHIEEDEVANPSKLDGECLDRITIVTDDEDDEGLQLKICSPRHVSPESHERMGSGIDITTDPVFDSVPSFQEKIDKCTDQLMENADAFDEVIELDQADCSNREVSDSKAKCISESGPSLTNIRDDETAIQKCEFPTTNAEDIEVISLDEDDELEQIDAEEGCIGDVTKTDHKDDSSGSRTVVDLEVTSIAEELEETITTEVDEFPVDSDTANITSDCEYSKTSADSMANTIPFKTVVDKSEVSGAKNIPPLKSIPDIPVICESVIPLNADSEQAGLLQGEESECQKKVFTEDFVENMKVPVGCEVPEKVEIVCLDEELPEINTEEQNSDLENPDKECRKICGSKSDNAEREEINQNEIMNSFGSDFTEISLGCSGPCSQSSHESEDVRTNLISETESSDALVENGNDLENTIVEDSNVSNSDTLCSKGAKTVISEHVNETSSHVENTSPQEQANGETGAKHGKWNHTRSRAELEDLIKSLDSPSANSNSDDQDDCNSVLSISDQNEDLDSAISTSVKGDDDNDTGASTSGRNSSLSDIFTDLDKTVCDETIENVTDEDIESDESVKSDNGKATSNEIVTYNEIVNSNEIANESVTSNEIITSNEITNKSVNSNEISSTSACSELVSSVCEKLTRPDVRSKLQQLEQAVKVHKLKGDSRQSPSSGKSRLKVEPAWNTVDEHASLIETYTEPDSSICIEEEHMVSSSGLDSSVIVLSDSE